MFLVKRKDGSFLPAYPSDWEESKKIKSGDEVYASKRRNIKFHRMGMGLLQLAFQNQNQYDNFDIYRQDLTVAAGFFHEGKDEKGNLKLYPKSLSFDKMDEAEFGHWYEAVKSMIIQKFKITDADIAENIESYF
jgi:hypothetical protein